MITQKRVLPSSKFSNKINLLFFSYTQRWLRTHCPGSKEVIEKRRQIYLGRECIRLWEDGGPTSKNHFQFSHQSFLEDDKVREKEMGGLLRGFLIGVDFSSFLIF